MAQTEQRWVKLNIPLVDEWFRVTKLPSDAIVLALHILRRMLAWPPGGAAESRLPILLS